MTFANSTRPSNATIVQMVKITFLLIGMFTVLNAAFGAVNGVVSTVSFWGTSLTTMLAVSAKPTTKEVLPYTTSEVQFAFNTMNSSILHQDVYFMDSGASFTIVCNCSSLKNIHDIPPRMIQGLTGTCTITKAGTLELVFPDSNGNAFTLTLHEALFDLSGDVNLITAKELTNAGFGVLLMNHAEMCGVFAPGSISPSGIALQLPLHQTNNVFYFTPIDVDTSPNCETEYHAHFASKFDHSTLEEILHRRFNHAPTATAAMLNGKVVGLPSNIRLTLATKVDCPLCAKANAIRQPFPKQSKTVCTKEDDL